MFGSLGFGYCILFVIWYLIIGILFLAHLYHFIDRLQLVSIHKIKKK
ncbi:hypothetical protein ES708_09036 [subsurface metagenome]